MLPFSPETFGELNADDYDEVNDPGTTDACVQLISEIANRGRILELAIGTGRIAIPLAKTGLSVSGIEGSPEMVAKLRSKDGGKDIPVTTGDMAEARVEGDFDHVFLVFNTLFNLQSQEAQLRCFQNAARHLTDEGSFLIEAFVPDLSGFRDGQRVIAKHIDRNSAWLEAAFHDPVRQVIELQRIRITEEGIKLVPLPLRYAAPPEIDLMAQLAGFHLENRWGDWNKSPFTADSKMHVSVYRKGTRST